MPNRIAKAASKATSISAGSGPSAEPLNLATAGIPELLHALGLDDLLGIGEGSLQSAGGPVTGTKPLAEMLGDVFTPKNPKSDVPRRVRLTSIDPEKDKVVTHALDKHYTQMDATPRDMAGLIREGELIPEGPALLDVPALYAKLRRVMAGASRRSR